MALKITDLTGTTTTPGGANPFGDVNNNPGGTLVDAKMVHDMLIFFQKLMAVASITPNSLPDNTPNGFQLYDALINNPIFGSAVIGVISGNLTTLNSDAATFTADILDIYNKVGLGTWTNITLGTGYTNRAGTTAQVRKDGMGRVQLKGWLIGSGSSGTAIGTLPAGCFPIQDRACACSLIQGGVETPMSLNIVASSGAIQFFGVPSPATGWTIVLDGLSGWLTT